MNFFNSNSKKEALEKLKKAQREYESNGRRASRATQSLYAQKKKAVKAIEAAEKTLKKLPDFSTDNIRRIADAKSSIRLFKEAIQKEKETENSLKDSSGNIAGAGVAGVAAGAAVATYGSTAIMALATTFGTTATGTAISALSGAAATNAALAWIGGGALAASGGGMAAGSAILAMAGPVGWAIGGITAGASGFFINRNNAKIAKKANAITDEINSINGELKRTTKSIETTREEISKQVSYLDALMEGVPGDDGQVKYNYPTIVETIEKLCKKINKKFTLKKFTLYDKC